MERTKNVLVCEDDPVQLRILSAMISQAGYRSLSARTPSEAVAAARRCGVDAVVADVQLQDGNAFDLMGDLRRMGLDAPVFMASAYATEGVKDRARAAGVRDFFEKPFSFSRIKTRLDEALRASRRPAGTVLLLESHSGARQNLKACIGRAGFRVVSARGGSRALALLARSGRSIDLLVLDLHSAGPSAGAFIRKALEIAPTLYVVAVSGDAGREEIRDAYDGGASAYLRKPIVEACFGDVLRAGQKAARNSRAAEEAGRERRERLAAESPLQKTRRWMKSWLHAPFGSRRAALLGSLALGVAALAIGALLGLGLDRAARAEEEQETVTRRLLETSLRPGSASGFRRESALGSDRANLQLELLRESNDFTRRYYQDSLQELRWQGISQAASQMFPRSDVPAASPVIDLGGQARRGLGGVEGGLLR